MPLPARKLHDMWVQGYCLPCIEMIGRTDPSQWELRMRFLSRHMPHCTDCLMAGIMKGIEFEVAKEMGAEAVDTFLRGEDIGELDGFKEAFAPILAEFLTPELEMWMFKVRSERSHLSPFLS